MANQFTQSYVELCKVDSVTLSVLSPADVEAMAVTKVTESMIYHENGDPVTNGINDDLMGTMDHDRHCKLANCMST
jgi:DNA-directed RNA polymerase beta' subunit